MSNTVNTIKLKEILGTIQVRLDSVDDKLNSLEGLKAEVNMIKSSFKEAFNLLTFSSEENTNRITRFPKGGKSL
jgi:hypothetical protein